MTDFYSTKAAEKEQYPIPDTLDPEYVLEILHDPSLLSRIFWPGSSNLVREEKKENTCTMTARFTIQRSPNNNANLTKAALTPLQDGVLYTEEMGFDIELRIAYTIVRRDDDQTAQTAEKQNMDMDGTESTTSTLLNHTTSSDAAPSHISQSYLEVERSIVALKPLLKVLNLEGGPIEKTRNFLHIIEELSLNGKDLSSALANLNADDAQKVSGGSSIFEVQKKSKDD